MNEMKIPLSKEELEYILEIDKIQCISIKIQIPKIKDKWWIAVQYNDLDVLRDFFGEQLQVCGFDENYELTPEGRILENLIDKFFI